MAEPFTLYKLIVLYMLEKVDFPLSNTQISDFFLEKEYTNYFTVQQVVHDLIETDLISTESTHSNSSTVSLPPAKRHCSFSMTRSLRLSRMISCTILTNTKWN